MASPSPATRRFNLTPNSLLLLRFPVVIIFSVFVSSSSSSSELGYGDQSPTWTPWPDQFHSVLAVNYSGTNQVIDLWYDWTNGRNFNIIQHQLGTLLYDLEWNNGTSFFYDYDSTPSPQCRVAHLDVGILRPNWLEGATYLGQRSVDGFLCNVWTKADFIWYYEDVLSHRPVHWLFYTGRAIHVMTFEVGAVLEDSKWQAPVYCFDKVSAEEDNTTTHPLPEYSVLRTPATGIPNGSMGALM